MYVVNNELGVGSRVRRVPAAVDAFERRRSGLLPNYEGNVIVDILTINIRLFIFTYRSICEDGPEELEATRLQMLLAATFAANEVLRLRRHLS